MKTPAAKKAAKKAAPAAKKEAKPKTPKGPTLPVAEVSATIYPVALFPGDKVHISKLNTRQPKATDPGVRELIASIAKLGQTTACIGRPMPGQPGHIELAAGARRSVALTALGHQIRIEVRNDMTDEELQDLIIVENLQREDPDPWAEAAAIARRIGKNEDPSSIAAAYGKDNIWLKRRMKLVTVIPKLSALHRDPTSNFHRFTLPMMEYIGTFPKETQQKLLEINQWHLEDLHTLEDLIDHLEGESTKELTPELKAAFQNSKTFNGACTTSCASQAGAGLFAEFNTCDACANPACFDKRKKLALDCAALEAIGGVEHDKLIIYSDRYGKYTPPGAKTPIEPIQLWQMKNDYTFLESAPKENDGQRFLAMDVSNPLTPVCQWVKIKEKPKGQGGSTAGLSPNDKLKAKIKREAKKEGTKLTADELSLAARKANLQRRRWKEVHTTLKEALSKSGPPDLTVPQWLSLFVTFGSSVRKNFPGGDRSKQYWQDYHLTDPSLANSVTNGITDGATLVSKFRKEDGKPVGMNTDSVWKNHFRPLFGERLVFHSGMESFDDDADLRIEMAEIAKLISFDLDAAKKKADLALPPAKSYGKVDVHTLEPIAPAK